ncbi:DUF58 domain-containing protein [Methylocella sp.]|uniref:DUF58 domain-containing protein n=1 Tax=Methylocella sp. TaxID=1978226 RepID=UPI0037839EA7
MRALQRLRAAFGADPPERRNSPPAAGALDVDHLIRLRHLALRLEATRAPPRSSLPGEAAHRRRGRGLEVHDVRAWSEGDDLRHLDRNITARTGEPHVRAFREERERAVLLVADFRPSMVFGTRRVLRAAAAAEVLALLGWRAAREGRVGLMVLCAEGTRLARYGRGTRAMLAAIGALAEAYREALSAPAREDPPLDALLEEADGLAGKSGALVVATALDAEGAGFADVVERIAQARGLSFALIADRFETAPPRGAYPYVTSGGAAGWLEVGAARPAPDEREARLRRLGARALVLDSGAAPETTAMELKRLDD